MASSSPASLVKTVDNQINMLLRKVDQSRLGDRPIKAIAALKQALIDAKTYSVDYELSEMRDEQLSNAKKAKKYLEQARQSILRASEFNVFGAVDTAYLSAQIDAALADLK